MAPFAMVIPTVKLWRGGNWELKIKLRAEAGTGTGNHCTDTGAFYGGREWAMWMCGGVDNRNSRFQSCPRYWNGITTSSNVHWIWIWITRVHLNCIIAKMSVQCCKMCAECELDVCGCWQRAEKTQKTGPALSGEGWLLRLAAAAIHQPHCVLWQPQ